MTGGGALALLALGTHARFRDTKERRVSLPHHDLVLVITNAQDQAKELQTHLEDQGHPQTNASSAVYLALVTLQKRLLRVDPPPPASRFGALLRHAARGSTRGRLRCYLSRMPRDIDVVGVWHGTSYHVGSVSSIANGVIVACGPAGRHTTYPKSGHRLTKDPSSGASTWYERQVLSDVTLAQPLQVIAFSCAKPPAWAKPYAPRPSHDSFTFQAQADGQVRLALVGVREGDDAVIVVTKQATAAPRLFRRYAPNVLLWTV